MKLTLKEKTIEFKYLQHCDIDVIEEQIKYYEDSKNIKFNIETFYELYAYSDICDLGGGEYDIDIHIREQYCDNLYDCDYDIIVSLNIDNITEDIAKEYEKEVNKYLMFRFIEMAVNNL